MQIPSEVISAGMDANVRPVVSKKSEATVRLLALTFLLNDLIW